MIFFVRSSDVAYDSRINKYLKSLDCQGVEKKILSWKRDGNGGNKRGYIYFNRVANHGDGFRNAWKLLYWNLFVFKKLLTSRKEIKVIHCVDLDTAVPVFLASKVLRIPYIFDVYDMFSESRGLSGISKKFVDALERVCIRNSEFTILADDKRIEQHLLNDKDRDKVEVIENVPESRGAEARKESPEALCGCIRSAQGERVIKIGYLGVLEKGSRGLESFSQAIKNDMRFEMHVVGFGLLDELFTSLTRECVNIFYYGPKDYAAGLEIMLSCDILLGVYKLYVPNHKYAAPNKYYEHLMLGKPLITSENTIPGEKVVKYDTGYVVNDEEDIGGFLSFIYGDDPMIERKGSNAYRLWLEKYDNYYNDIICGRYVKKVSEIIGR